MPAHHHEQSMHAMQKDDERTQRIAKPNIMQSDFLASLPSCYAFSDAEFEFEPNFYYSFLVAC